MRRARRIVDVLATVAFLLAGCAYIRPAHMTLAEQATASAAEASGAAAEASLASTISRRALENVLAQENEAKKKLAEANKSEVRPDIKAAARSLKDARKDSAKAQRTARQVSAYTRNVQETAAEVKCLTDRVIKDPEEPEAPIFAEKAARLAKQARKTADKAQKLAETLKKHWLSLVEDPSIIPPPATNTAAVSAPNSGKAGH